MTERRGESLFVDGREAVYVSESGPGWVKLSTLPPLQAVELTVRYADWCDLTADESLRLVMGRGLQSWGADELAEALDGLGLTVLSDGKGGLSVVRRVSLSRGEGERDGLRDGAFNGFRDDKVAGFVKAEGLTLAEAVARVKSRL